MSFVQKTGYKIMDKQKLLQLWNYPFYKLSLQTVDVVRKVVLQKYVSNFQIIGKFKFKPPYYLIKCYQKFDKSQAIQFLNGFFADKNFVKKYKKTVTTQVGTQTIKFFYVFNLSPDAVVDYSINGNQLQISFKGIMVYKK